MRLRFTIVQEYVTGARVLANRASELERSIQAGGPPAAEQVAEYRACAVGAVPQAAAAIEAELSEVLMHGPQHDVVDNPENTAARKFLEPLFDSIDKTPIVMNRWKLVLHLLKKPPMNTGVSPCQDACLLFKMRNELVHYKSEWDDAGNVLNHDKKRKFAVPASIPGHTQFPLSVLGAALAQWGHKTAQDFLVEIKRLLASA